VSANRRLYRRLFAETRGFRPRIGALVGLSAMSSVFALLTPVPLKIAVDSVVSNQPMPPLLAAVVPETVADSKTGTLIVASVLFVVIALLKQLQSFAALWLATGTGQRLLLRLRSRLFRHAEELSLASVLGAHHGVTLRPRYRDIERRETWLESPHEKAEAR